MDLMSLIINIGADISGAQKGIDEIKSSMSSAENKTESFKTKVIGAFKAIAATAAVKKIVDGIYKIGSAAYEAYASYEQLVGGVDTLFKDASGKVQQYANEAYRTAGLSANEYMETVTSFSAAMIQSLGGDTQKAAELSNQAIIDMSDNANKMGTSMEAIQSAYMGFSKQNYTMLDNLKLGYGGTKSEMDRLIKDAAKLDSTFKYNTKTVIKNKKAVEELDYNYADIVRAIHIVQDNMGISGTTAKEAADTIEGSMGSLKAAWKNFILAIGRGEGVSEAMDMVIDGAMQVVKNSIPVIKRILGSFGKIILHTFEKIFDTPIGRVIKKIVSNIGKQLNKIPLVKAIKDIFSRIVSLIKKYGSHIKLHQILAAIFTGGRVEIGTGTSFVHFFKSVFQNSIAKALLDLFNGDGTFLHSIMQPIINALGTLDDLFLTIKQQFQPVLDAFKTLGSVIGGLFTGENSLADLKEAFKGVWESIVNIDWGLIWNKIKAVFESWKTLLTETIDWKALGGAIWQKIKDGIKATGDWLKETLGYSPSDDWLSIGKDLWGKIKTGIKNAVKGASDWLKTTLGYSPSDDWMTIGGGLWEKIVNGVSNAVKDASDWLKTALGYSPSDDWLSIGSDLWTKITTGISNAVKDASDWLKDLLGYTPDTSWSEIGVQIWNTIKTGITEAGDWIKSLVLGDEYTPDASWVTVGEKIWGKITEGLAAAVDWLQGVFNDWTDKLTKGEIDFASIGVSIWTAISSAFSSVVEWFVNLFGGDTDSVKSEVKSIDWAGLSSSIFGLITGAFKGIGDTLKEFFIAAWNDINKLNWAGLGRNMWNAIKKAFAKIADWFKETFKTPINAVIGLLNAMLQTVQGTLNKVIGAIRTALTLDIPGFDVGPIHYDGFHWEPKISDISGWGEIPTLAKGGTVFPGGTAIVGEAGAELLRNIGGRAVVTPLGGNVGGDSISINIYQQPGESADALADKIQRILVRRERQRRSSLT